MAVSFYIMIQANIATKLAHGDEIMLPIDIQIPILAYSGICHVDVNKSGVNKIALALLRLRARRCGYTIEESPETLIIKW